MRFVSLRIASIVALAALPALFVACGSKRGADTVGATGSIGSTKTVTGGVTVNKIGRQLDDPDRRIAAEAEFRALEYGRSGSTVDWKSPATKRRGSIVPGKPYQVGNQYCRPYTHTIYTGSSPDIGKATACRSPEGNWRSVG
jgi:surface antigen